MRERLTAAFVLLTLVLVLGAALIAGYAQEGVWRERDSRHAAVAASGVAALVDERLVAGRPVDEALLSPLVSTDERLEVVQGGDTLVVVGDDYDGGNIVSSTMPFDGGYVLVQRTSLTPFEVVGGPLSTKLLLVAAVTLLSGVVGYLISRSLSQPFRQLAVAAAALGRGRFDLDLPTSGNPEAQAIARALGNSAGQLRDRLEREQRFALHASHVLRTPLTSLRLQLDELVVSDDVSADARAAAARGLQAVEELDAAAGELVDLARASAIMAGAEIPLRDLATVSAQRWANALDHRHRGFSAAVEGEHDLLFTPGPVETVLDMLLEDTLAHGLGDVRLVLEGDATTLRIDLFADHEPRPHGQDAEDPYIRRARLIVEGLGGWLEDRHGDNGKMTVLLPRR